MVNNHPDRVPGRNEPDPKNIRQNSFQAGSDGLTQPPTDITTYGEMKYTDDKGPYAEFTARNAGAGLSGTAQADTGATPALFNDPTLKKR